MLPIARPVLIALFMALVVVGILFAVPDYSAGSYFGIPARLFLIAILPAVIASLLAIVGSGMASSSQEDLDL